MVTNENEQRSFPLVPSLLSVPTPTKRNVSGLRANIVIDPTPNKLFTFRVSQRWVRGSANNTSVAVRACPFVTREGVISSNAVHYWKCSASQLVASTAATVYNRLVSRWRRWSKNGSRVVPNRDLALRIAVLYTLTLDTGRLTRTLECAKRNEAACRRLVYQWSRIVDAQTRFWYGQLTSVTLWLQRRAYKARDKSTNLLEDYRIIEVALDKSIYHSAQIWINNWADFWVRRVNEPLDGYILRFACKS